MTDATLENTDLDGRQAVWMNGRSILWKAEGVSFHLGGPDLTLEQAKAIAIFIR